MAWRAVNLISTQVAGAQNCVDGLLDLHDAPNADDFFWASTARS